MVRAGQSGPVDVVDYRLQDIPLSTRTARTRLKLNSNTKILGIVPSKNGDVPCLLTLVGDGSLGQDVEIDLVVIRSGEVFRDTDGCMSRAKRIGFCTGELLNHWVVYLIKNGNTLSVDPSV